MTRSQLTGLKSRDFCYMYTLMTSDFFYILSATYILTWLSSLIG